MTSTEKSPIRPTDDAARALARRLLAQARFAALGVIDPDSGAPMVSRVAFGLDPAGTPLTLISDLSHHTRALKQNPMAPLLVGEPEDRGDPLTHPRLTLMARARFVANSAAGYRGLAEHYLRTHPKSKLYIGFGDFSFAVFDVTRAHLNGGFGKAFSLSSDDLKP